MENSGSDGSRSIRDFFWSRMAQRKKGVTGTQERIYDLFHLLPFVPKESATSGIESRGVCKLAPGASLDYPVRK